MAAIGDKNLAYSAEEIDALLGKIDSLIGTIDSNGIVQLYDGSTPIYPITKGEAVQMASGNDVEEEVSQLGQEVGNVNDIYILIPVDGDGNGYVQDDLSIGGNNDYRYYIIDISNYAGKRIRLRAGDTRVGFFTYFCHLKLADNSVIHLFQNTTIVTIKKDFVYIDLPNNVITLYLTWKKIGTESIIPLFAYEPLDDDEKNIKSSIATIENNIGNVKYEIGSVNDIYTLIPENGNGNGYVKDDLTIGGNNDYRYYIMDVSNYAGKRIRLRAGNCSNGNYYFAYFCHIKLSDDTIIHLHQNSTYVEYKESFVYVDVPNNATTLYITWDKRGEGTSVLPMVALEPLDGDVKELSKEIAKKYFNLDNNNYPVLPPHIFLQSDKAVPFYKNSLLINPGDASRIDINIIAEAATGFLRKIFEIKEPIYFNNGDFAQTAKFFLQRVNDLENLYYKDVKVFHKDVSAISGRTVKVLSLGDSLTQGLGWYDTPVTMLAQDLSNYGVTLQYVGTLVRTFRNNLGQDVQIRYEGRGGWRYRTFVGMESKFVSNNIIIPSETQHEWVEGVDGTIDEIKAYNPWLYPATAQDLVDNPNFCFHFVVGSTVENKSYAEDSTLGTYYIFDPVRYFSERQIDIPDIVTIALGTNEWYLGPSVYGGFDNAKATACAEFMIKQFRKVSANLKIVVIPLNNFPITRQSDWAQYCMPLCANVIRVCDNLITAGDTNLFVCPIYANGSRWLGYNTTEGSASAVSEINDMQKIKMDNNVHMLYRYDDSNFDYRNSLLACIVNLIE